MNIHEVIGCIYKKKTCTHFVYLSALLAGRVVLRRKESTLLCALVMDGFFYDDIYLRCMLVFYCIRSVYWGSLCMYKFASFGDSCILQYVDSREHSAF